MSNPQRALIGAAISPTGAVLPDQLEQPHNETLPKVMLGLWHYIVYECLSYMDRDAPKNPLEPTDIVHLRRPPFWSVWLVTLMVVLATLFLQLIGTALAALFEGKMVEAWSDGFPAVVLGLLLAVVIGRRLWVSRQPLNPIRFLDYEIELPASVHSTRMLRVPYTDVLSTHLGGYPPHVRVLVETKSRVFRFDQVYFAEQAGPELVFLELRRRIMQLPQGKEILAAMQQRHQLVDQAISIRPWATQVFLGVIWVIYLVQYLTQMTDEFSTLAWGASSAHLVRQGEYYRLLSANFLHIHWLVPLHIGLNSVALYSLGGVMERFLGWQRFVLVLLLSGLGTTIASVSFAEAQFSAGASGCVLGIFGGLAVINVRYWTRLPLGFRQTTRWWTVIIGINLALTLFIPMVDTAGHLGGTAVGALITYLLVRRQKELQAAPPASHYLTAAALGLTALFAVGLATAVWRVKDFDEQKRLDFLVLMADDAVSKKIEETERLNYLAWMIAIHPNADENHLALAETLAKRAVSGEKPQDSGFWRLLSSLLGDDSPLAPWGVDMALNDTLATVFYRQGRYREAAELQGRFIEARPENFTPTSEIWSQYERFLAAYFSAGGALSPDGLDVSELRLTPVRPDKKAPFLELTLNEELRKKARDGLTLYALVWRGEHRTGLLRVHLGPIPIERYTYEPGTKLVLVKELRLGIAALKSGSAKKVEAGKASWHWHPTDPEVASYP